MEAAWIAAAFALGLVARHLGLPPLVGYLAAGFALNAFGLHGGEGLEHVAHVGVLLLLFAIGLKLRLATLAQPEVMIGGLAHLALVAGLGAAALVGFADLPLAATVVLAVGLAFSSTVMAGKVLEEKAELKAFHGRVAIGILILQDLVAVAVLSLAGGDAPSPWALLWLALPLLKALLQRLLQLSGHGDLMLLYGLVLALAVGGLGFERVGLSAELGALVLGTLLADHPRAGELGGALWGVKELFLVGFFLSIGMAGLPDPTSLAIAAVLLLLLPVKVALYFFVLVRFRLRVRTCLLAALALASYSEFGLIVVDLAARRELLGPEWLVGVAVAVAVSFAVAAPLNAVAHRLFDRWEERLLRFQSTRRHRDDEPISLGGAEIAVFGMGRVGTGAYEHLTGLGARVIGLDSDPIKVANQEKAGRWVLYADAEDPDLWDRLDVTGVRAVLLALPDLEAKRTAAAGLRARGFTGLVTATNEFADEAPVIRTAGADATFNYYDRAGESFAATSWKLLQDPAA